MSHPQEMNPKPDILKQAMNCIYDSNLQILLDEITDLKTRIENLERQIIQIIVIPDWNIKNNYRNKCAMIGSQKKNVITKSEI